MNAYVAATDPDWFHFLRDQEDVDEVNFWYPKPWGGTFGVLTDGQPLLFKLKAPHNHVAGGRFFKRTKMACVRDRSPATAISPDR